MSFLLNHEYTYLTYRESRVSSAFVEIFEKNIQLNCLASRICIACQVYLRITF